MQSYKCNFCNIEICKEKKGSAYQGGGTGGGEDFKHRGITKRHTKLRRREKGGVYIDALLVKVH